MKPYIVGEGPNPTYVGKPHLPLFGGPTRVLCAATGIQSRYDGYAGLVRDKLLYCELRRHAVLVNLCVGAWDLREAESRATIFLGDAPESAPFVLLGRRVARAFGRRDLPFMEDGDVMGHRVVILPHPSGLNRLWNDPALRAAAGAALRRALRLEEKSFTSV